MLLGRILYRRAFSASSIWVSLPPCGDKENYELNATEYFVPSYLKRLLRVHSKDKVVIIVLTENVS